MNTHLEDTVKCCWMYNMLLKMISTVDLLPVKAVDTGCGLMTELIVKGKIIHGPKCRPEGVARFEQRVIELVLRLSVDCGSANGFVGGLSVRDPPKSEPPEVLCGYHNNM